MGYSYRKLIKNRFVINPSVHLGVLNIQNKPVSLSSQRFLESDEVLEVRLWSDDVDLKPKPSAYFDFRLKFGVFTEKNDLVGWHVGYRYPMGLGRELEYSVSIKNPYWWLGAGSVFMTGREFYAGLTYTLNNFSKIDRIEELSKLNKDLAKKDVRKTWRVEMENKRRRGYRISFSMGRNHIKENYSNNHFFEDAWAGPGPNINLSLIREKQFHYSGILVSCDNYWSRSKPTPLFSDQDDIKAHGT